MNKANIFIGASWVGGAGLLASLLLQLLPVIPEQIAVIAGLIAFTSCWVLLATRNADEYTRGLWTSAASLAFASLLVMMIGAPFLEGIYVGFTKSDTGGPSFEYIIASAIFAFYVGLFWKLVRGDM